MSEMVERVARALWGAYATPPYEWGVINPHTQARWHQIARVAIDAMREPTEAMVKAGEQEIYECRGGPADWTLDSTRDSYRAMIDEAQKTESTAIVSHTCPIDKPESR